MRTIGQRSTSPDCFVPDRQAHASEVHSVRNPIIHCYTGFSYAPGNPYRACRPSSQDCNGTDRHPAYRPLSWCNWDRPALRILYDHHTGIGTLTPTSMTVVATMICALRQRTLHFHFFFDRLQSAMHHADPVIRQSKNTPASCRQPSCRFSISSTSDSSMSG